MYHTAVFAFASHCQLGIYPAYYRHSSMATPKVPTYCIARPPYCSIYYLLETIKRSGGTTAVQAEVHRLMRACQGTAVCLYMVRPPGSNYNYKRMI